MTQENISLFKTHLHDIDWKMCLKENPDVSITKEKDNIIIQEIQGDSFSKLQAYFEMSNIPFSKHKDGDKSYLKLKFEDELPKITFSLFLQLFQNYFVTNSDNSSSKLTDLINTITSVIFSQVKLISSDRGTLYKIIEHVKYNHQYFSFQDLFNDLFKDELWKNLMKNDLESIRPLTISMNSWLHIIRHPNEAKNNFAKYITYLRNNSSSPHILQTKIPLPEPYGFEILVISILGETNDSSDDLVEESYHTQENEHESILYNKNKMSKQYRNNNYGYFENFIAEYWFSLGSLILRNLNYSLTKIKSLTLEGFESKEMTFYKYMKPKLIQFSESCYNNDLVEGFKLINRKGKEIQSHLKGIEFYSYNRGVYLQKRLKQVEKEFNKNSRNKTIRKRYNRRKNKISEYFNANLLLNQSYLVEIEKYKQITGKYISITKLIDKKIIEGFI